MQTRSGRLVLPRYYRTTAQDRPEDSTSSVVFSDDHGKTWQIGGDPQPRGQTNECQVAELSDGSLLLNMRGINGTHRRITRSSDGGITWSPVTEDPTLIEPRCQASLLTFTDAISQDRNRLLFANPAGLTRANLVIRLSYDDGKSWPVAKTLNPGPSAYSCLTVLADATIGCLYERGATTAHDKITFARFNAEWLTAGRDHVRPPTPN
jgi:sialidase-1